jgi:alpha-1,3-rhamnosyl/mannosyltransferase
MMAEGLARVRSETGGDELAYEPVFLVAPGQAGAFHGFEGHTVDVPYLHPSELWRLPRELGALKPALYHSPTFSSLMSCPCPWIQTVHDLNHLHYGGFKERLYYRAVLKRFARRARTLITISEFSRAELDPWVRREDPIEIVYNALDPKLAVRPEDDEIAAVLKRRGLEKGRYFFCLSNPKPHKNVRLLVEAHAQFRAQGAQSVAGWPLVLSMSDYAGRPGILALGGLPEPEVRALLAGAGALVFPSLYEGFGLPPLEAAALGVPVVVSRIEPHREALPGLAPHEALWVEPRDFHGWVSALHRVSRGELSAPSPDSRRRLVERFSPERLGRHMDRIYRRVLAV